MEASMRERAIALIGFGEVGGIFARDLRATGARLAAWDILFPSGKPESAHARLAHSAADAVRDAELIISAVTAAQTLEAAHSVCSGLPKGAWFLDLNSASPAMKKAAAGAIEAAGGRYVEAAVMSPVPPKRLATPMLLGGPHAQAFLPLASELGLRGCKPFSPELGKASAAKMCRSVMVKGIEALLTESLLSARRYGVENEVVGSLGDLFPGPDWRTLARYMISRSLEHGKRRAEEMREVAVTVREAGLSPLMSSACAERQGLAPAFADALEHQELAAMLDAILNAAGPERPL
jgi:3-hydroxyisobutyrate dehydrogenase-like beta-hydroxyacid dehydrogenase